MTDFRCLRDRSMVDFRSSVYRLRPTPGESDGGIMKCRSAVHAAQNAGGVSVSALLLGLATYLYIPPPRKCPTFLRKSILSLPMP
jgi:hypothetical protein